MSPESVKFDRAVEYYDETRGFPAGEEKPAAELIARVGDFDASSRIIEIGVGTGRIALPVSRHVGSYFGLDLSRPMMDKLRAKQNGEAIYLTEGDATQLPYADRSFDGAVAVHVFHLIPGWKNSLRELARVLRPDVPLVNCWTWDDEAFRDVWMVWNETVQTESRRVGARLQENPNFLEDEGWQPTGEVQSYGYTVNKSAGRFLQLLKSRCWSALWSVSDEEMARGLAVIEPLIKERYPNPDAPIEGHSTFFARAYLPPQ